MTSARPGLIVDERDAIDLLRELLTRRAGYTPEWQPGDRGPGAAVLQIASRYADAILRRLDQAPDKHRLAFFDLLAFGLTPAQAARALLVFTLAPDAQDVVATAGTQAAAAPPAGSPEPLTFETETETGITGATLRQVFSLWPGRDQYIDHTQSVVAGTPFTLFDRRTLTDVPHEIYIGHDTLLALDGSVGLNVHFELRRGSSEELSLKWQYWDGSVWRGFRDTRQACAGAGGAAGDSTLGLRQSGEVLLEADGAAAKKRVVNGVESFWLRGQLTEPLTRERGAVLPDVESLSLSTTISQPLSLQVDSTVRYAPSGRLNGVLVFVQNDAGRGLERMPVFVIDHATGAVLANAVTAAGGFVLFPPFNTPEIDLEIRGFGQTARVESIRLDPQQMTGVLLKLRVEGLLPDKAFADGEELDTSKPFYPLGMQPAPGATFYFSIDAAFGKPGARVQIYTARTATPQDSSTVATTSATNPSMRLSHLLAWEYWSGREWTTLFYSEGETRDLAGTELIEFDVPRDIEPVVINDDERRWIRVRLVSGAYGFSQTVTWVAGNDTNRFTYVIPQPPALSTFRIGYAWQYGPFPGQHIFTHNDFVYRDHTYEARWPGASFPLFSYVSDVTPAVYLGFDRALPPSRVGLFLDVVEPAAHAERPPLTWEYWNGGEWRRLTVVDETRDLSIPGIVSVVGSTDSAALARFGTALQWVRGRLSEDGPPPAPSINWLRLNAVWASERRTLTDAPLGASTGQGGEVFTIAPAPVLRGEQIEVRELAGLRANVEWRLVALELAGGRETVMRELERLLAREGPEQLIASGSITLRRDRERRVTEVWVRWRPQPHLLRSGPDDRHYTIDRARGLVAFGDGRHGRLLPAGAQIIARRFQSGGGSRGNVAAGQIAQLVSALPGVQAVTNPIAAEGGADRESLEAFAARAPRALAHGGRAVAQQDYETIALEAAPDLALVRAVSGTVGEPRAPGNVTLLIVPRSNHPRPQPAYRLRDRVRRYIEARCPATLAGTGHVHVLGPTYEPVGVELQVAPVDVSQTGTVERRVRSALERFLHPVNGGPAGIGWRFGRSVYLSDVAAVVEAVEGVDHVRDLMLMRDGAPVGASLHVPPDRVPAAGLISIKVLAPERQLEAQSELTAV